MSESASYRFNPNPPYRVGRDRRIRSLSLHAYPPVMAGINVFRSVSSNGRILSLILGIVRNIYVSLCLKPAANAL